MKNRNARQPWKRAERQIALAGKRPYHRVEKLQKERIKLAHAREKRGL